MTERKLLFSVLLTGIIIIALWIGSYFQSIPMPFIQASAKTPPAPLSIGVVDINSFKTNSKVFQKFQNALEDMNTTIHNEILDKETRLRTEKELLEKEIKLHSSNSPQQDTAISEPTRERIKKKKAEFERKVAELEMIVRKRRKELEEEYTRGLIIIKQALKEIMNDLGKTHGLKIILNKSIGDGNQMDQSIVLFCNEGLDLTNEVISRLDKQLISRTLQN
jgi:Skp family chaperone for outer membrane proteins